MPNSKLCSIEGCDNPAKTKGWCGKHYMRLLRYGDPDIVRRLYRSASPICTIHGCSPMDNWVCRYMETPH